MVAVHDAIFGKINRRFLIVTAIVAVVLGNAVIFLVPHNTTFKNWRAGQLAREALSALAHNDSAAAIHKTIAALQLSPRLPEVERAAGKLNLQLDPVQAVYFYKELLAGGGWRPDDLFDAERAAIAAADLPFFREIARRVPESLRHGQVYDTLQIESLLAGDDLSAAVLSTRNAVHRDPSSAAALSSLLLNFGDPSDSAGAMAYFEKAARDGNPTESRDALVALMNSKRVPPKERLACSEKLFLRPDTSLNDKLACAAVLIELDPARRGTIIQSLVDRYAVSSTIAQLGAWLVHEGELVRAERLFPLPVALSQKDYFLIWLDAVAGQNRWADVREALKLDSAPLEPTYLFLFRGRADAETGNASTAQRNYENAIQSAGDKPATLAYLTGYFQSLGLKDLEVLCLQKMTSVPATSRFAYEALINLYQGEKDTLALLGILEQMAALWPNDNAVQNDVTYLKLLLNRDISTCAAEAERRQMAHPDMLPFRVTNSLGLLRNGEPTKALDLFENSKTDLDNLLPWEKAVFAAVLASNGLREGATAVAASIPDGTLKPEEESLLKQYLAN